MPPKKGLASHPKQAAEPKRPEPTTYNESCLQEWEEYHPYHKKREEVGLHGLTKEERTIFLNQEALRTGAWKALSAKAQKAFWKQVNEASLCARPPRRPTGPEKWGKDKYGRNLGELRIEDFTQRRKKQSRITLLRLKSECFKKKRSWAETGWRNEETGEEYSITEEDTQAERERRREMAVLSLELYGDRSNPYAEDPEWDDVTPIPQQEPEGALAAIAYPDDYAEAMGYLRAVMLAKEYSPRCLKLTEHIISMNPAHYTVWLYRFSIVEALKIPIPDEITWLNEVSLEHLKNYQIWHHRQLLMDHYYSELRSSEESQKLIGDLGKSEVQFIETILEEDTKNYHVWSYRQYLVRKLGLWNEAELVSIAKMIDEDVRNNSAWSHRFFIVFSDPAVSTENSHATEHDPKLPTELVSREVAYAQEKIELAPQNQSPWNYLKGVLTKGGRKLSEVQAFAEKYVQDLGAENESVRSSHALDLLAEIYGETGEVEKADLALQRLAEKWDRIRVGYWEWRRKLLKAT